MFHSSYYGEVLWHLVLLTEHVDRHGRVVFAHRAYSFREGCDHLTKFACCGIYYKATYVLDCIFNRTKTRSRHALFTAFCHLSTSIRGVEFQLQRGMTWPIAGQRVSPFGLCGYFPFLEQTSSEIVATLESSDVQLFRASRGVLRDCFLDGCRVYHVR